MPVIKKQKRNKYSSQGLVCVTKNNIRFFKDVREASKIMGIPIPQVFHEMKTRGKNSANRAWYSESFYKNMKKKKKKGGK